jgi:hypothetical protein
MSLNHRFQTILDSGSPQIKSDNSYSGDGGVELGGATIPAGATDQVISIAIDVSQVKSIVIQSDKAITIKTNSLSSPTNTLVLKAGVPYVWNTDSYDTLKLTGDVTSFHCINAGSADATLTLDACYDSTL